jgi:undecaprenyl-diphosphatase
VFETKIMEAMRENGAPFGPAWLADAMRDMTALGSAAVLMLLSLMIVGYLWLSQRRRMAIFVIAAVAGGQLLNFALKNAFHRARPASTLHLVNVASSSFPSGHAMAASIFYLTMGALLTRTAKRRREKAYLLAAALLCTTLVGFSRVYLGVHYPSDVLAGCAAGTAWAVLCWWVADKLARRGSLRAETREPAPATP